MNAEEADDNTPGRAMQKAMAERGCELSLDEAREFSRSLLRLFELGALVFYDADGNEIQLGEDGRIIPT